MLTILSNIIYSAINPRLRSTLWPLQGVPNSEKTLAFLLGILSGKVL